MLTLKLTPSERDLIVRGLAGVILEEGRTIYLRSLGLGANDAQLKLSSDTMCAASAILDMLS